ncbi:hypothetical protein EST38_g3950 [Candolleomyces aberdarensis]|uniref:RZ-type domain-containing protein n=1 Tax=Candolleomyces aberdarensis TaxID=2316362 RepID=A0A4Q2DRR7_9AGAR|nr:hypothetical protein EST38_g3950 [Candolleomyces aberdarensis]
MEDSLLAKVLLKTIAEGNGLLRINNIVQWPQVAFNAGSSPVILSFQRGYLPLLSLLSSDFVVKSTLNHLVNALYMRILENIDIFSNHLKAFMNAAIAARSFKDPRSAQSDTLSGSHIFTALSTIFFECLTRFKNAVTTYPALPPLVSDLAEWVETWVSMLSATPPTFVDPVLEKSQAREFVISYVRDKVKKLVTIIEREVNKKLKSSQNLNEPIPRGVNEGVVSALKILYEGQGPGSLRPDGPRHDNDFDDIQDIRIAPTHEELVNNIKPYLPANFFEAPHHLPSDSMERLLDIQFRLLREELTAPLRTSLQLVQHDLIDRDKSKTKPTQLANIIKQKGGKYKGFVDKEDSVLFNVYTNVSFTGVHPDRRGISVKVAFDTPPGRGRSAKARERVAFWEGVSGKRLIQGGLIALVWEEGGDISIHLGVLATNIKEITDFVKENANATQTVARIVFFDTSVQLRILQDLKKTQNRRKSPSTKLLVESPVMFEAIRPFLEALRVEPETLSFKDYLVHHPIGYFPNSPILPPKYSRMAGFQYQLAPLFSPDSGVTDLRLSVNDPESIASARDALKSSRLDPSQADAVVDTLLREVSLIQGPPGTGKSFVGLELLRVLLASARPILMIAFTNHALDHMLAGVLDAKITDKIVRLGSRSADERISGFSLENLEKIAGKSDSGLDRINRRNYYNLKETEKEIERYMKEFTREDVSSEDIMKLLQTEYPEHFEFLSSPPDWIRVYYRQFIQQEEGWTRAGPGGRNEAHDTSEFSFWAQGHDITFLANPQYPLPPPVLEFEEDIQHPSNRFGVLEAEAMEDEGDDLDGGEELYEEPWERPDAWRTENVEVLDQSNDNVNPPTAAITTSQRVEAVEITQDNLIRSNVEHFFHGLDMDVPVIPLGDREDDLLLLQGDTIWSMSFSERARLHAHWRKEVLTRRSATHEQDFEALRRRHQEILTASNEGRDEIKRQLLKNTDIVGCTTTGAAKLASLLKGLSPRILLVEEAGQVLEAHVLGSLVPSIEHLILIGDPLQLRPTLNNYSLSMDSERGKTLYRFDMSLMERLSSSGFPMSQINVQRRMRPEISNLIRETLYPGLVDNELVENYPDVRGIQNNVFFLDHDHPENDGNAEDTASKFNVYEVEMIRDLVLYLLRQGCYSQDGDIVVLCAYLGQLAKVRDALHSLVAVVIDERDQKELADREEEADEIRQETVVEHVKISSRVRLRTVDNYQGEEAKVVILSLVRNAGGNDRPSAERGLKKTIGFLRADVCKPAMLDSSVVMSVRINAILTIPIMLVLCARRSAVDFAHDSTPVKGNAPWTVADACTQYPTLASHVGMLPPLSSGHVLMLPVLYRVDRFVFACLVTNDVKSYYHVDIDAPLPCVVCADDSVKGMVVDLILGETLADIPITSDSEELDAMIITLPNCRHVFTVETLDGVCGMNDWYECDENAGKWTGIRVPTTAERQPPACPSCRASITSPRYSRVFKAADLDILEKNVIAKMTQGLGGLQRDLDALEGLNIGNAITQQLLQLESITAPSVKQGQAKACIKARQAIFSDTTRSEPISPHVFTDDKLFLFSPETSRVWKAAIRPITKLLSDITRVTKVRPAHVHAWESAFTYLYNQEIDAAAADPARAPRNPHEYAIRMAKLKLGQAHPRADRRFLIEAFWISLELRFTLLELINGVLDLMSNNLALFDQNERATWAQYGRFTIRTCVEDSSLAYQIAEDSQSRRQMTSCRIFTLRSALEQFRFSVAMSQKTGHFTEQKKHLLELAVQQNQAANSTVEETIQAHIAVKFEDQTSWLDDNFRKPASVILEEWDKLGRSIRMETLYEPLSLAEKMSVVKAMGFSHTGHWYNCPNGHTFVIGECGGAMQASICPECGEGIGGSDHRLNTTNARAEEYEQLGREQGVQRSPWAWGN